MKGLHRVLAWLDVPAEGQPHAELAVVNQQNPAVTHQEARAGEVSVDARHLTDSRVRAGIVRAAAVRCGPAAYMVEMGAS